MPEKKNPFGTLGIASAVYALFYTFCLYKNASGITYPFFVAGTLGFFFFCMKRCGVPCDSGFRKGWKLFYTVSVLLLGLSVCLTDDWKLLLMTKTGLFLLTMTLAVRLFGRTQGNSFGGNLRAIGSGIMETLYCIDKPIADGVEYVKAGGQLFKNKKTQSVLLGLLIALPLLAVILALLFSADAVFFNLAKEMAGDWNLREPLLVCLMIAAVYMVSYSFIRGLTSYETKPPRNPGKKGEPIAAITFTSLIALVYLAFCAVQILYLFIGKMQLPEGLTWASYARQGFFQLLFVCLINLVMVLLCLALFGESRILKGILTAISLMTYIMVVSSALRMFLYIQNYYMTFLRLMVLWALAVIAVVLVGVIIFTWQKSFPLFGYCTVAVTLFYLVLAFARPDFVVAKYDISHASVQEADGEDPYAGIYRGFADYEYLNGLSADAALVLTEKKVEAVFGSARAFSGFYERNWEKAQDMNWRTFNFSRWLAGRYMGGWYDGEN